uniref:Resolvase/invertase-type recombinase catalytic domain-containing protein n=1 Tax=Panagrellus redivivus TaxID=6233 RepID=A0A7E4VKN2_PANRE
MDASMKLPAAINVVLIYSTDSTNQKAVDTSIERQSRQMLEVSKDTRFHGKIGSDCHRLRLIRAKSISIAAPRWPEPVG